MTPVVFGCRDKTIVINTTERTEAAATQLLNLGRHRFPPEIFCNFFNIQLESKRN